MEFDVIIGEDGPLGGIEKPTEEPEKKEKTEKEDSVKVHDDNTVTIGEHGPLGDIDDNNESSEEDDEQEEKDDSKEKQQSSEKEQQSSSLSSLPYSDVLTALSTDGIFSNSTKEELEEAKTNPVLLASLIQKEIENNEFKDLDEETATALKALRSGASWKDIMSAKEAELEISDLTEESLEGDDKENLRKDILRNFYQTTTKFSKERIEKEIKKSIDSGNDEVDAIDALKELKELRKDSINKIAEQAEKSNAERVKAAKAQREKVKNDLKAKTEILGLKVTPKMQDKIYESIYKPVNGTNNALVEKYNTDEEFRVNLHYIYELTKGLTDLTPVKERTKKSALEELAVKANEQRKESPNYQVHGNRNVMKEQKSLLDKL